MDAMVNGCLMSDDKGLIQVDRVYSMLITTYWASNRAMNTVQKSIENSLCFGIYKNDIQVAFARSVTDYATAYWLCDVIVHTDYRGRGLGKALMKFITEHDDLKSLIGVLSTDNAHGLYEQFGFLRDQKGNYMRRRPDPAL